MYRDFSEFDVDAFCVHLNQINWDYIYSLTDINQMVHFVSSNILTLFDLHAPLKKVRIFKSPAPWMAENLKLMIKLKCKALSRYKKFKTDSHWNDYKSLRSHVNISVRTEKKAFLQSAFKSDPKRF